MSLGNYLRKNGVKETLQEPIPVPLRPEILMGPNTPKPMHGVAPRVVLGTKWWNEERNRAYKSTNYHCLTCGVHRSNAQRHKWLEGHEVYDVDYRAGRLIYVECVPLCHYCHNYIHSGRLQSLLEKGDISHQKFAAIVRHGDSIIKQSGLVKPLPYDGPFAEWSEWRLLVNGQEFSPLYKSLTEWEKVFR